MLRQNNFKLYHAIKVILDWNKKLRKTFEANSNGTELFANGISKETHWIYYCAWQKEQVSTLKMVRLLALSLLNHISADPAKSLKEAAQNIYVEGAECFQATRNSGQYSCCLVLGSVVLGSGGPASQPAIAHAEAYKCAIDNILKPQLYLKCEPTGDRMFLSGYYDSDISPTSIRLPWKDQAFVQPNLEPPLPQGHVPYLDEQEPSESKPVTNPTNFILLENYFCSSSEKMLQDTADFNKQCLRIVHDSDNCGRTPNCSILIQDRTVAYASGRSKRVAKNKACEVAIRELRRSCWCLKVRKVADVDIRVTRESLLGGSQKSIASDSLGARMMKKMGWEGGRLGKNGSGLLEPIHHLQRATVLGQGLGFGATGKDFDRGKVNGFLENFACNCKPQQKLVFSAEFTKAERDYIKRHCQNLYLMVKESKRDGEICLVVSRKWDKETILRYLSVSKDEMGKYELVAPSKFLC